MLSIEGHNITSKNYTTQTDTKMKQILKKK